MPASAEQQRDFLFSNYKTLYQRSEFLRAFARTDDYPLLDYLPPKPLTTLEIEELLTYKAEKVEEGSWNLIKVINKDMIGYYSAADAAGKRTFIGLCKQGDVPLGVRTRIKLLPEQQQAIRGSNEETNIGRLTLYLMIFSSIAEHVPYMNVVWKSDMVGNILSKLVRDNIVTVAKAKEVINTVFYLTGMTNLFAPAASAKSFITDEQVPIRKRELLEEYEGRLSEPLVAAKIESELIAMDKKFLGDDPSTGYYNAVGENSYKLHRRKMFLTTGGMEEFNDTSRNFEFIKNSIAEGWDPKDFGVMVNDLRKGSYDRGVQTRLGGALAKAIQRAFQNIQISGEDCGTSRGIPFEFTKDNIDRFIGRLVRLPKQTSFTMLTEANKKSFVDQTVVLRSPLTCQNKPGLCYACTGDIFRDLKQRSISMLATSIGNTFQTQAMKSMHGTTIKALNIDFTQFFYEAAGQPIRSLSHGQEEEE